MLAVLHGNFIFHLNEMPKFKLSSYDDKFIYYIKTVNYVFDKLKPIQFLHLFIFCTFLCLTS